jgi:hypothetical protein
MVLFSPADAPWRELNALIQQGVWCRAMTPAPLMAFLTGPLGLADDYVRTRVETIFLDGMVVDDLNASVVRDGSTVTLSAAMPGLVGATLRRGGYYRAMRAGISWSTLADAGGPEVAQPGLVRVKLFNLVLREMGPSLLRQGVLVDPGPAIEALGAEVAAAAGPDGRILVVVDEGPADEDAPCR